MSRGANWIVCQLGARERYAIPRALRQQGLLRELITDFWFAPGLPRLPFVGKRMAARWSKDLAKAKVSSFNGQFLAFEFMARLKGWRDWELMIARNRVFQYHVTERLRSLAKSDAGGDNTMVFSYCYSALEQFREAKRHGWKTVLGQIDLGPMEDDLEKSLLAEHPEWPCSTPCSPPSSYWQEWREECALADTIIVNSEWARSGMIRQGIAPEKLVVIPLAYEVAREGEIPEHNNSCLPTSDSRRPLRVLFLGQVVARKGIHDLISAARLLEGEPLIIDVVGAHLPLPSSIPPNLRFHGAVALDGTDAWYRAADVFVLPTHSDGFAITQLEAMSHGLPVITTPHCGAVVEDGWNGLVFQPGDTVALAGLLRRLASSREELEIMGRNAAETVGRFSLGALAGRLASLS